MGNAVHARPWRPSSAGRCSPGRGRRRTRLHRYTGMRERQISRTCTSVCKWQSLVALLRSLDVCVGAGIEIEHRVIVCEAGFCVGKWISFAEFPCNASALFQRPAFSTLFVPGASDHVRARPVGLACYGRHKELYFQKERYKRTYYL
jgi:hypothetical protein